jgi:hypothetical protein
MPKPSNNRFACVKEQIGHLEISIAFDDSSNPKNRELFRSNIRVYNTRDDTDITYELERDVFGSHTTIDGNIKNLMLVYAWCLGKQE